MRMTIQSTTRPDCRRTRGPRASSTETLVVNSEQFKFFQEMEPSLKRCEPTF